MLVNEENILPSENPPNGLLPKETPQFIIFGFDDNGYSGLGYKEKQGLSFFIDLFASFTNPQGNNNKSTFDSTQAKFSFYAKGEYINDTTKIDSLELVTNTWKHAVLQGHEIGNHTYTHTNGKDNSFNTESWHKEISHCEKLINNQIKTKTQGFRTPFLAYNQDTFKAIESLGYTYDCSLLSGLSKKRQGHNNLWPYTLPKNTYISDDVDEYLINNTHSDYYKLIELPISYIIAPPDELCEKYGVSKGLRDNLASKTPHYPGNYKIPGVDWNIFSDFGLSSKEALACLKYSIDIRLSGNRSPLVLCFHADMYVDNYDKYDKPRHRTTSACDRRKFTTELFDYLKTKEEIRIVNSIDFIDWFLKPTAL